MFKWLKKRLGLEPQPIDPDFGTRLGQAMGSILTSKITADRITATEIKLANAEIVAPQIACIEDSSLEALVESARELTDMVYRNTSLPSCRRHANEHADLVLRHVELLRKHKLARITSKTDRLPGESEADYLCRLLDMAANK